MGYKLNGSSLPFGVAFQDSNGTNYSANWLAKSTAAERAAVPTGGIVWEQTSNGWDQGFYTGHGVPKRLDDETVDGVKHTGLKTKYVQQQKDIARSLIEPTDWMAVRQYEGGTAMPSSIKTYRANVRTQCGLREATLNACSTVEKLRDTVLNYLPPKIAGTASNGATEKKDESGNSYDPIQYNDIDNPDLLEAWPNPPT